MPIVLRGKGDKYRVINSTQKPNIPNNTKKVVLAMRPRPVPTRPSTAPAAPAGPSSLGKYRVNNQNSVMSVIFDYLRSSVSSKLTIEQRSNLGILLLLMCKNKKEYDQKWTQVSFLPKIGDYIPQWYEHYTSKFVNGELFIIDKRTRRNLVKISFTGNKVLTIERNINRHKPINVDLQTTLNYLTKHVFPGAVIKHRSLLPGRYSNIPRQSVLNRGNPINEMFRETVQLPNGTWSYVTNEGVPAKYFFNPRPNSNGGVRIPGMFRNVVIPTLFPGISKTPAFKSIKGYVAPFYMR
jgi:hypothetical protein